MSKADLFNKKGSEDLEKKLKLENFERITCSFYQYTPIDSPEILRNKLYLEWNELKVLGRVYLANEGINAQISIPKKNWNHFVNKLYFYDEFNNIPFKIAVENNNESFIKLIIRTKNQIVADGLIEQEYDLSNIGTRLTAKQFNDAMELDKTIVIDVRNHYESEVGHFEHAICPDVDTFKESLPVIKELLKGHEEDKVLLYCTGGIRCEKTSAYLKYHNFKDVNQLEGGIISYSHQIKTKKINSKFRGKNFVFDKRMGERITDEVISNCHQCDKPSDSHINCKNQACHILFIQCDKCNKEFSGSCSKECQNIAKLPIEEQREIRKIPTQADPLMVFKNRIRPKLKEIKKRESQ